ncbi:hypothetical protein [Mycobacterium sp.]|jgi:hypothetical protein|uniref:hypothetical protein n=1 Tax=Mycobacterium sp. TaxID=1785 RepID=UPI002D72FCE2|nr:hypothetical protein [Mycobacterium sp.]HZA12050.1 hypothetical protein [Mycobacterium sp.]
MGHSMRKVAVGAALGGALMFGGFGAASAVPVHGFGDGSVNVVAEPCPAPQGSGITPPGEPGSKNVPGGNDAPADSPTNPTGGAPGGAASSGNGNQAPAGAPGACGPTKDQNPKSGPGQPAGVIG